MRLSKEIYYKTIYHFEELLKDRSSMVNWDFLTTPNKLVRKNITYGNTKTTVKPDVKYLNGQTALDWIRMGYLNELIARDLQTHSEMTTVTVGPSTMDYSPVR